MERSEASYFSAAFSCTFLASCLLFSAFNRQQRAAYMDEAFHVQQAQAYCAGRFQQVGRQASERASERIPESGSAPNCGGKRGFAGCKVTSWDCFLY